MSVRSRPLLRIDPLVGHQQGPLTAQPRSNRSLHDLWDDAQSQQHVTSSRSLHLEILINSAKVEHTQFGELKTFRTIPVFDPHENVSGSVILGASCERSGKITITLEGSFTFRLPTRDLAYRPTYPDPSYKRKHVFLNKSVVIPVSGSTENGSPRSAFRETFVPGRKRSSASSQHTGVAGAPRSFPFKFNLPSVKEGGEHIPESFSSTSVVTSSIRARAFVESAEVSYRVTALWEPVYEQEQRVKFDAPLAIRSPPVDPHLKSDRWVELPFKSHDSDFFHCAITLPDPTRFARSGFIPYYVVYTTSPLFDHLVRDIATSAILSISLVREINVSDVPALPLTPPRTPSPTRIDPDITPPASPISKTNSSRNKRVLRRMTTSIPLSSHSKSASETSIGAKDKEQKRLSDPFFSEKRTVYSDVRTGFPKRARRHDASSDMRRLPDGLYKSHILLSDDILPSINWAGTNINYFLDIAVSYQDFSVSARVPITIF